MIRGLCVWCLLRPIRKCSDPHASLCTVCKISLEKQGLMRKGAELTDEMCGMSGRRRNKLNDDSVREIRRGLAIGESRESLAEKYGCSANNIKNIEYGRTWRHAGT